MIRRLKILAVAMGGALAIVAIAPPLAAGFEFSSEEGKKATLDGESIAGKPTVFKFDEKRSITCEKTGLSAFIEEPSSTLSLGRSYEKCTATILGAEELPTTAMDNGCTFVLHLEAKVKDTYLALVDILCAVAGIEFDVYEDEAHTELVCSFEIVAQNSLERVEVENGGGMPNDLVIRPNVEKIEYVRTAGNMITCGPENGNEATYTGSTTAKGTDEKGNPLGIFVN